ncbi:hypothetical protein BDW59DRAFT_158873 [Aspergillus cavernicola]|uniref:Uncharacterized protein n=1 Tax=Aspergillus cavernicola TaxID=176166 RepID=A0ABR4IQ24_9EURO
MPSFTSTFRPFDRFREVVFNITEREMIDLAVRCTQKARALTKDSADPEMAQTEWTLEFTPENFQDTQGGLAANAAKPDYLQPREAIIRLNAQSGKGGIEWYINDVFHIDLPRELEIDFTKIVKSYANVNGLEITHDIIRHIWTWIKVALKQLGFHLKLLDYTVQTIQSPETTTGSRTQYASIVKVASGGCTELWGVGINEDYTWAAAQQ